MKKTLGLLLSLLVLCSATLFAAPYYENGSQIFTISAGTNIPLYASSFESNSSKKVEGIGPGAGGTNFTVGGYGSIDYEVFLHPYIAIGGELGYQFNFITSQKIFSQVPMLFKVSFVPLQGSIEIPISLGIGMNYMSYDGNSQICLMAQMNVGVRYFFTDEWGLGINSGITFTPELYASDSSKNGILTFVPINLAVSYRH